MSQNVTESVAADVVVLLSEDSIAVTGLADTDVTAEYRKEGGIFTAKALTGANFADVGNGTYTITFTAAELDTVGSFTVVVTGASIDQSTTVINVVAAGTASTSTSLSTCVISGYVLDLTGAAVLGAAVSARVVGAPSIEQSTAAVTDQLVSATTDDNGQFFITLVRLADVEIFIPIVNFRRRLVVPNEPSAELLNIS